MRPSARLSDFYTPISPLINARSPDTFATVRACYNRSHDRPNPRAADSGCSTGAHPVRRHPPRLSPKGCNNTKARPAAFNARAAGQTALYARLFDVTRFAPTNYARGSFPSAATEAGARVCGEPQTGESPLLAIRGINRSARFLRAGLSLPGNQGGFVSPFEKIDPAQTAG